jgi:putative membrane protein
MRSTTLFRALTRAAICAAAALAVNAGCKTSTATGGASSGAGGMVMGGDGGMTGMDGGAGGTMKSDEGGMTKVDGGAGGSMAHDIGQGAGTAAGNVASGVESAGRGIADAGAAAYGAASSAASGAATTAADAARDAAAGARAGVAPAMDAGASGGAPGETPGAADAGATGTSQAASAGGARLSDAQIAAVAVAANKVDIEAGRAARRKTKNAQVKRFANDMIRDHTSANKQAAALVKKLGVTPEENETSRAITQGGKDNLANLQSMKGKELDRAYAEHEVAYHQEVLGALDQKLIPAARNAELKSLLQSVRAVVAQHLDHAAALAESLSK